MRTSNQASMALLSRLVRYQFKEFSYCNCGRDLCAAYTKRMLGGGFMPAVYSVGSDKEVSWWLSQN